MNDLDIIVELQGGKNVHSEAAFKSSVLKWKINVLSFKEK